MDASDFHIETASYGADLAKYGPEEEAYLVEQIQNFWSNTEQGDFDCVDNIRLARQGAVEECAEYEETQRTGCCGSHDIVFGPSPNGHSYLYGFNYGH